MSKVTYDSNILRPVQQVSVTKSYTKTPDGTIIGKIFNITVFGTIIADRGSPNSLGVFWTASTDPPIEAVAQNARISSIMRKQEAIRELFSQEGLQFEVIPLDGSQSLRCNPRINSITFEPGLWIDICRYTIELECDELYPMEEDVFLEYIQSADESWNIETDETAEDETKPRTYRLTHNVSAVGKKFYDDAGNLTMEAWEQAKDYVVGRLGFDSTVLLSSGVINLPAYYGGFNHIRSENRDERGGSYSVVETWIIASGTYLEDFTVSTRDDIADGLKYATINGNVQGLEQRDSNLQLTTSKWTNALSRFNTIEPLLFNRAQTYSGYTLNNIPLSKTTGRNPVAGNISYNYEYNNRFRQLVSGTISEVINLNKTYEVDLFAVIPVIGRAKGSLPQGLLSKQIQESALTIELVFDSSYIPSGASISELLYDYNPRIHEPQRTQLLEILSVSHPSGHQLNNLGQLATVAYITNQNDTWDYVNRRFSYSIAWVYE